jgi:hypothetical protein
VRSPNIRGSWAVGLLGLQSLWLGPGTWAQGTSQCRSNAPAIVAAVGAGLVAAYDIGTAPASARWYNDHLIAQPMVRAAPPSIGVIVQLRLPAQSRARSSSSPTISVSDRKSPGIALALSASSTVVPVGIGAFLASGDRASGETAGSLIAGGVLIGPSVGHWYAGRWRRGLASLGVRLGLAALGLALWKDCG